ncbi:MAG: transposase [Bradyrhizobium sp.]|nr:transposase [Bradyrhizobium sp.]
MLRQAYRSMQFVNALFLRGRTIEIVKRSQPGNKGSQISRRSVVERPFVWLGRCHRLAEDFEVSAVTEVAGFAELHSHGEWAVTR